MPLAVRDEDVALMREDTVSGLELTLGTSFATPRDWSPDPAVIDVSYRQDEVPRRIAVRDVESTVVVGHIRWSKVTLLPGKELVGGLEGKLSTFRLTQLADDSAVNPKDHDPASVLCNRKALVAAVHEKTDAVDVVLQLRSITHQRPALEVPTDGTEAVSGNARVDNPRLRILSKPSVHPRLELLGLFGEGSGQLLIPHKGHQALAGGLTFRGRRGGFGVVVNVNMVSRARMSQCYRGKKPQNERKERTRLGCGIFFHFAKCLAAIFGKYP